MAPSFLRNAQPFAFENPGWYIRDVCDFVVDML